MLLFLNIFELSHLSEAVPTETIFGTLFGTVPTETLVDALFELSRLSGAIPTETLFGAP